MVFNVHVPAYLNSTPAHAAKPIHCTTAGMAFSGGSPFIVMGLAFFYKGKSHAYEYVVKCYNYLNHETAASLPINKLMQQKLWPL